LLEAKSQNHQDNKRKHGVHAENHIIKQDFRSLFDL